MNSGAANAIARQFAGWHRPLPRCNESPVHPFRKLLGGEKWDALPQAVRDRFVHKVAADTCISYVGEVVSCRTNSLGKILSLLGRLIGAPLPLGEDAGVAAQVSVTGDARGLNQYWTRSYNRSDHFPQTIHSVKRFAGPTGLEEYLGYGIGIALRLEAIESGLLFVSDHYFLKISDFRLRLPRWMEPGQMTVSHIDCGKDERGPNSNGRGHFAFVLELVHPYFGELFHQLAVFADPAGLSA